MQDQPLDDQTAPANGVGRTDPANVDLPATQPIDVTEIIRAARGTSA